MYTLQMFLIATYSNVIYIYKYWEWLNGDCYSIFLFFRVLGSLIVNVKFFWVKVTWETFHNMRCFWRLALSYWGVQHKIIHALTELSGKIQESTWPESTWPANVDLLKFLLSSDIFESDSGNVHAEWYPIWVNPNPSKVPQLYLLLCRPSNCMILYVSVWFCMYVNSLHIIVISQLYHSYIPHKP